jgi:hypothetical protein
MPIDTSSERHEVSSLSEQLSALSLMEVVKVDRGTWIS